MSSGCTECAAVFGASVNSRHSDLKHATDEDLFKELSFNIKNNYNKQ